MSVCPVARHICTPLGTGIIAAGPLPAPDTVTIAFTTEASTGPMSRIRAPLANSISTAPGVARAGATPGPGAIATGAQPGSIASRNNPLLLGFRPPLAALHRRDHLNLTFGHRTILRLSPMTCRLPSNPQGGLRR